MHWTPEAPLEYDIWTPAQDATTYKGVVVEMKLSIGYTKHGRAVPHAERGSGM